MADEEKAIHPLTNKENTPAVVEKDRVKKVKEKEKPKRKIWNQIIAGASVVGFILLVLFLYAILGSLQTRFPSYGIRSATFDTFDVKTSSPHSFELKMNAELFITNSNHSPYRYKETKIDFFYNGTRVGTSVVLQSIAGTMKTTKFNVVVDLIAAKSDISSGLLSLTSKSTLAGKVKILVLFKKLKRSKLDCKMDVNISTKTLQNVKCKHRRNTRQNASAN